MNRPIRVIVAKVGLDGHERGAKIIVYGLRDAGMEVIYTGLRRTPDEIAEIALQEDVDVVGLSILSGAVVPLTEKVAAALRARGLDDVGIIVGGILSPQMIERLRELGVEGTFGPGSRLADIVEHIRTTTGRRRAAGEMAGLRN